MPAPVRPEGLTARFNLIDIKSAPSFKTFDVLMTDEADTYGRYRSKHLGGNKSETILSGESS